MAEDLNEEIVLAVTRKELQDTVEIAVDSIITSHPIITQEDSVEHDALYGDLLESITQTVIEDLLKRHRRE